MAARLFIIWIIRKIISPFQVSLSSLPSSTIFLLLFPGIFAMNISIMKFALWDIYFGNYFGGQTQTWFLVPWILECLHLRRYHSVHSFASALQVSKPRFSKIQKLLHIFLHTLMTIISELLNNMLQSQWFMPCLEHRLGCTLYTS